MSTARLTRSLQFSLAIVLIASAYAWLRNDYLLGSLTLAGIYAIAISGLVVLIGIGGQFSLGHAAFLGIGSYTAAILSRNGFPMVVTLPVGGVAAAALAVLTGYPLLRLRGYYLAVATLALGLIVLSFLNGWRSVTHGPSGLTDIPSIAIGSIRLVGDRAYYWAAWMLALIGMWTVGNLQNSRIGRAMLAVKHDETAAAAMGINVHWTKVQIFALSAAYAGVSGALYAHYVSFISPERFNVTASFELLLAALLGGAGSSFGAALGALLLIALPEIFGWLRDYKTIVYGVVFILVSLYLPNGLAGLAANFADVVRWRRGSAPPAMMSDMKQPT